MNDTLKPNLETPADLWQRDEPLRRAAELIERSGGAIKAVSFDFFDTIVWRLVGKPTDVFVEVGRRLSNEKLLRAGISPAEYEILRRHGEMKARERQNAQDPTREDINVSDIYSGMQAVVNHITPAVPLEHQAECDLCVLNPIMASFIRHVVGRGLKVLVVSDIYFSAEQLKDILRANQFDPSIFELVITSADAGVCKGTGNLFKRALKSIKLQAEQIVHIGDNYQADVIGARRAGVRGCHYPQASQQTFTILEREKFLLGGQELNFSGNSLRMLAARLFPGDSDEAFFSQMGALIMGPTLTRYASWACKQFVEAGVKKVGAFMREGELFGKLLQQEAAAHGYDLEIEPLYVNRKATDLAAIGRLTANNVIAWLEARPTLPIQTILEHMGLRGDVLKRAPLPLDEKADRPEKILKLAEFLFQPEIAQRIEERSAEERRKVLDYLKPWLASGTVFGVCDIGYSASAQTQLKRIFDLEEIRTHMVGCYLVSYERAADRILAGVDIRSFLGAYGHPDFYFRAFIRAPAFLEQSITAACGTTLGYERLPDGTVQPILDQMPYDGEMLRRQRAFKAGVLEFQRLWLWVSQLRPGLLDGKTEFSRRLLEHVDRGFAPILLRATAFPTANEVARFGSLKLDDYYFDDSYKLLCGPKDREQFRLGGYAKALGQAGVHWPHGLFHAENPRTASEFFSCGKALLLCDTNRDGDGALPDVSIVLPSGRNAAALRECVTRLKSVSRRELRLEIVLIVANDNREMLALGQELAREVAGLRVFERNTKQSLVQALNAAADTSHGPVLLFADEGTLLSPGWDAALLESIRSASDVGVVLPQIKRQPDACKDVLATTLRGFVMRRSAFVEGLGLNEELTPTGAAWELMLRVRELDWRIEVCAGVTAEIRAAENSDSLYSFDKAALTQRCASFAQFANDLVAATTAGVSKPGGPALCVDWVGSFLDAGSLSHVNRELTAAIDRAGDIKVSRVTNGAAGTPAFENLAKEVVAAASGNVAVTVRHEWPPDWRRPKHGKLVVIQPWEFGSLPSQWVENARQVDEFWLPSEYVRRVYAESGVPAQKLVVVPNGVDAKRFNPQAAPMKLPTQKTFKFLFVGGTILRKGPDLLLKAYLENFTAADDVCLVIKDFGGQGVYAGQTFEEQIRTAQATPNAPEILYLNEEMSPELLPGLYTACNCLVLPYRGEGFGLPVLEAMACGLPVVVTAGGATDDFVRDEFAWRIPAQRCALGGSVSGMKLAGAGWMLEPNLPALGEAMRSACNNPVETRKRGQRASRQAQAFTWEHSAAIAAQRIRALANNTVVSGAPKPEKKGAAVTLPPCALVGHLAEARELLRQKKARAAWEAAVAALAKRPFHPEAFLLLAEIAQTVGAGEIARKCAEHARGIAPAWKPAKQFLNQRLKGNACPEWMTLPAFSANRLSVCLIVKNEEKFLGQCLKSVQGLATQIVVVDTGSTDRTVEIARAHGAKVHAFAWNDDFSAARNAMLEHVTGDWVLALDADEELAADAHAQLQRALEEAGTMAWRLPIVDVGREAEGCSYVPRLFRNAPGLFYVGRVHEQVFSSIEVRRAEWGLENRIGEARLIHHGYTAEVTRDRNKVGRNLRLLEQAMMEFPEEPHLLMNYGLELARSGREADALVNYREAFRVLSSKPAAEIVPELLESLLTQLCSRLAAARCFQEIVTVLSSPLARRSLTASLHFSLGLAHIELKQFGEAVIQMRECLAKRNARSLSPINRDILTAAPHHCLALALCKTGQGAEAEVTFKAGLAESGHGSGLRIDYARFLAEQGRPVEALQLLHEVVTMDAGNVAAWQLGGQIALSRAEFLEFAGDWTTEAIRQIPQDLVIVAQRAETLMLNGDFAESGRLWAKLCSVARAPKALAGLVLCQLGNPESSAPGLQEREENLVSRAFLEWYQRLILMEARTTLAQINTHTETLMTVLPTAAEILRNAMNEAAQAETIPA